MVVMISEFDSLLLSTPMESDEEHRTVQGMSPEYGAIFMSSSFTKDECFRRRLFGLPSGQGPFVKQIKSGMILFLFEFEKRELHGVFQASSDGRMNIVSNAWSRSGKKFPAQVRVNPIWHCHPLPESEFGDAIKENYFSKWKFNFGLSKAQVWRLLMLFNLRKLKSPHPQRALARNTAAQPVDIYRELDDGRLSSDKVGNLHKVDNTLRSIIQSRYLEHLPGKVERDDAKFGNGVNVDFEHRALSSTEHTRSGQNGRCDGSLAMCGREGSVSHLDGPFYSGMPLQETYSLVQDKKTSSHQMELPITGHSYAASRGDAIITSILPYDPDDPSLNLAHSRLVGNYDSVQDCDGQNGIPAVRNEVNPSYTETNGLNQSLEDISKVDVRRSLSAINITPFPGATSSAEMAIYYSKSSLAPESLSEFGSNGRDGPSSYPLSPSNYPSFLVERRHPVAIQNKPVHEIGPFTANVTSLEEIQCQSPCRTHSADLESVDYHDCKCSDRMLCSDLLENRSSVFSRLRFNNPGWCLENLGHLGHEEDVKDTSSVDEVMEMLSESHYPWMESEKSKLHKRRQGNAEKSRNLKQTAVKSELEMIPEKANTASASPTGDKDDQSSKKTLFVDFKRRSDLRKVDSNTNGESAGSEGLLGGQCKRRKLIRPNFSENEPRDNKSYNRSHFMNSPGSAQECRSCEDAGGKKRKLAKPNFRENKSSQESSAQCSIGEDAGGKRRKLARPNFGENESSLISSPQCSVGEAAGGSCGSFVGSQGKSLLQDAESSHDNEKIDTECVSKYEREIIVESSGGSPKIGDDSGKGCLHAYPGNSCLNLQASVDESSFCEDANCKKKLVGPDFRENELFQVSPHECSSGEYAGENYEVLVGSHGNIDAQRCPTFKMETKLESSGESLKIGDESGKDPVHDVGSQIAIVPSKDDILNAQEDLDHKDPMVLSRDGHQPSQSTVLESASQLKTNGFSEFESDRGSELEMLTRVEFSPNIAGNGGSRKQNSDSPRVSENISNRVDAGMINYQHGSSTEQGQASCNSNQHDSLKQEGFGNDVLEAVEFGDNVASDYTSREREIDIKLESFVDSVKSGDENGMESVQVGILSALEDSILTRLSEDFPETDQITVLESATQPKTNSGTSNGFSEIEADRGSELQVLPIVERCPNTNASNRADASMVNNQQGVNSEQLQTSCNSNNHRSHQEHGSKHNVQESMEFGDNEAIDDTVRENKRQWSILTARLQLVKRAQQQ
ncbi:uncharacterized protein LOC133728902 [Rosa rugosa]|uniref:uncharacterized protein LOC133728902 n=1 Tax=Rosa rugosa TaxID=74645 RepID=UPI002B40BFF0|nr:uncharacterized protein LOC133728902 [Rosa rugosa]